MTWFFALKWIFIHENILFSPQNINILYGSRQRHKVFENLTWTIHWLGSFLSNLSTLSLNSLSFCSSLLYSVRSLKRNIDVIKVIFFNLLAMFLSYQVLGPPGSCEPFRKFVNLTQFSLPAVLSSHLRKWKWFWAAILKGESDFKQLSEKVKVVLISMMHESDFEQASQSDFEQP